MMRNLFGLRIKVLLLPVVASTCSNGDTVKRCISVLTLALLNSRHGQAWQAPPSFSPTPDSFRRYCQYDAYLKASSSEVGEVSQDTNLGPIAGSASVLSQKATTTESLELQMLSFYHFQNVEDPVSIRDRLFAYIREIPGLRGTIYIAKEGINAQIAVPPGPDLEKLLTVCRTQLPFDPFATSPPNLGRIVPISTPTFNKLIIRTRDYILRDGISQAGLSLDWSDAGPELSPSDWHNDILSHDIVLLDCRNSYESDEGTFDGAIPLGTRTFQDSWAHLDEMMANVPREKPVYIFCTGGIRCVKVGAYMKQHLNFCAVKRLQHGIIGYEKWQSENPRLGPSAFLGENFIFDKRRFEVEEKSKAAGVKPSEKQNAQA